MNSKKAKLLRKLVNFHPANKREYGTVVHGKRKKLVITEDAKFKEEFTDCLQYISKGERRAYQVAKRIYKEGLEKLDI